MSWGYVAIAAGTVISSVISSEAQKDAAEDAAAAQQTSGNAGIDETRRQFDAIQKLLAPYVQGGERALGAQQDLLGLNGGEAQVGAIRALESSPMFTSLVDQGENAILQNASATGGLRGGNTQAALAEFRPAMLARIINEQYAKLGGLTSLGQNAAAGVGNAGQNANQSIVQLLQQIGAAQAGAELAGGKAAAGTASGIGSGIGMLGGLLGGASSGGGAGPTYPSIGGGAEGGYVTPGGF